MALVRLIRPIKNTRLYRANQRCWVIFNAGSLATHVIGKYRGKGRYVRAWLHYPKQYTEIKEIEVSDEFAERLGI